MLQRSILEGRWSLLSLRIRLEDLSKEELIEIIKEKIKEIEKLKKEKENLEKDLNKYKYEKITEVEADVSKTKSLKYLSVKEICSVLGGKI